MTITAISDTHGQHLHLDFTKYKADVLIHAGDWTRGRDNNLDETKEFLWWLSKQPFNHKILIAGNHELRVEANQEEFYKLLEQYPDIIYLQDSEIIIDDIKFYGSPYSNKFYNWAFMEEEIKLSKIWAKIPEDTQVLITHGPAYGCHDEVKHAYGRDPHVGSQSLHYRKLALQDTLKLHISGHIHEQYGISTSNSCTNICASVLNEKYELINNPIQLEI